MTDCIWAGPSNLVLHCRLSRGKGTSSNYYQQSMIQQRNVINGRQCAILSSHMFTENSERLYSFNYGVLPGVLSKRKFIEIVRTYHRKRWSLFLAKINEVNSVYC